MTTTFYTQIFTCSQSVTLTHNSYMVALSGTINSIHCVRLMIIQANIGTYMYVHIHRYCRHISSIPFNVQTGPIDQPTYVLTHIPCMHLYTRTHCFPIRQAGLKRMGWMYHVCIHVSCVHMYMHTYVTFVHHLV